jgi:hypothetical protein
MYNTANKIDITTTITPPPMAKSATILPPEVAEDADVLELVDVAAFLEVGVVRD